MVCFGKDATTLNLFAENQRTPPSRAISLWRVLLILCATFTVFGGDESSNVALAQITTPPANPNALIRVAAFQADRWQQGQYEVLHLRGRCEILQDAIFARSDEAVIWIDRARPSSGDPDKVMCYLEGDVVVDFAYDGRPHASTGRPAQSIVSETWFGRFYSTGGVRVEIATVRPEPRVKPAIYERGLRAMNPQRTNSVQPAQFTTTQPAEPVAQPSPLGNLRRVQVRPRGSGTNGFNFHPVRSANPNEQIWVVGGGVRVNIEADVPVDRETRSALGGNLGDVVILCDQAVIWSGKLDELQLNRDSLQRGDTPLEIYMEGNIVFAQGERVIYAQRMYYNVPGKFGIILNAEMLTPVPNYEGLLRIKSDVLQQLDEQNFMAYNAALTSSRLGVPRYWFQSENVSIRHEQEPLNDPFTGQPQTDPITGAPVVDHRLLATSRNNFTYVGGLPVFYWPVIATDLTRATYYLNKIEAKSDSVFGTQILTDWDVYQLLGIRNQPEGTDWSVTFDYLSERGFAAGSGFRYSREGLLGIPGDVDGFIDAWGIDEHGRDNLGRDRRALFPEEDLRGRILARHRHELGADWLLTGEFGLISDRNFLEQYYEREWDEWKDQTTGVELKRQSGNTSLSITADVRLNDFFTQTERLPQLDHYVLGQSLFFDRVTWHAHSHVGFLRMRAADVPSPINPSEVAIFNPLPWEADLEGVRAGTRHELDLPINAGPFKIVPYVLGDLTYWQQDVMSRDMLRVYGQAGVRASMPLWRADPTVQDTLFNLNGLAHKVVVDAEFFWADASQNLDRLPLYDPLDDDAQEAFRRRIPDQTFFGAPFRADRVPTRYDERFYARRTGLQSWVTSPSAEIADDLMVTRLGVRQRWQTKRGTPGQERIIDWIVFDVEGFFYPRPLRDNFGADVGLVDYEFRWHIGDRLALLSDGFYDFFGQGMRSTSLGAFLTRPGVGNLYLGFRTIEGPISSNVLSGSLGYRMSDKWLMTAGSSVDFAATGNIGQHFSFVHIGESFLTQIGFSADVSRGNIGVRLAIEPRFLPQSRLGQVGGVQIPPAGAFGFE